MEQTAFADTYSGSSARDSHLFGRNVVKKRLSGMMPFKLKSLYAPVPVAVLCSFSSFSAWKKEMQRGGNSDRNF